MIPPTVSVFIGKVTATVGVVALALAIFTQGRSQAIGQLGLGLCALTAIALSGFTKGNAEGQGDSE